jgi:YVTN family beta-propeller protein
VSKLTVCGVPELRYFIALTIAAVALTSVITITPYSVAQALSHPQSLSDPFVRVGEANKSDQLSFHSPAAAGFTVGSRPLGITVDPRTNITYVVNSRSNTVSVIAPLYRILANIPVGNFPVAAAVACIGLAFRLTDFKTL